MKWSKFLNAPGQEYRPGDWFVIDDVSGFQEYASEVVRQWDGFMTKYPVARNEQDFLPSRSERGIPWARPEPDDTFGQGGNGSDL